MKIRKAVFSGFRNVPDGEYNLDGKNVLLVAENTYGKSHFMDGIKITLAKMMAGPGAIKEGAKEAKLEVHTSDYNHDNQPIEGTDYKFSCRIHKTKSNEQKCDEFVVICPNGLKEEGKTTIGSIVGELDGTKGGKDNFVELSRTEKGQAEQLEIVRGMMNEATQLAIRLEEQKVQENFDLRSDVNVKIKNLKGTLLTSGINPLDLSKEWTVTVTSELIEQRDLIVGKNNTIDQAVERNLQRVKDLVTKNDELKDIDNQIKALELKKDAKNKEIKEIEGKNELFDKYIIENPKVSTADLDEKIKNAETHNAKVREIEDYRKKEKELAELEEQSGNYTVLVDAGRQCIKDAIRDWDSPMPGLTFDDNMVYWNGKQVHPDVMSEAEQMVFNAQLKMAQMKKARVLFVGNASLIGFDGLIALQEECDKHNIQLILEEVERGTKKLEIRLMPDYKALAQATEEKNAN